MKIQHLRRKQDEDLTMGIQERVTSYSQRYIDKKTKHYLKETTLMREVFSSYLKYTKTATRDVP